MQIAQAAFAVFDIGLHNVAAVAHALVPFIAFGHFQAHKIGRRICDHFVPEA